MGGEVSRNEDQQTPQELLSDEQLRAFYHEDFVEDQTRHFVALVGVTGSHPKVVVDVGGGCGFFAKRLAEVTGYKVKVLDMDQVSVEACHRAQVEAIRADALNPPIQGDEDIVSFNLILHHLVGASEGLTRQMQSRALAVWRNGIRQIFINEYIYESYLGNFSGWLIYQVTKNRVLSWIGRTVSKVVPSFRANTFGVGVRFRSHREWKKLFDTAGYEVTSSVLGERETVSLPLRLLLIRCIRRDSFLLNPRLPRQL